MVCLYCGKKLTMVKKLTAEDFCSAAHRQTYNGEQEKLAVARLVDQQLRMNPGRRPPAQVRPISQATSPQIGECISQQVAPRKLDSALRMSGRQLTIAMEPMEPDSSATIAPPRSLADAIGVEALIDMQALAGVEVAMRALSYAQATQPSSPASQTAFRLYRPGFDARPFMPQGNSQLEVDEVAPPADPDFDHSSLSLIDFAAHLKPKSPVAIAEIDSYGAKRFAFSRLPEANTQREFSSAPPHPAPIETTGFEQLGSPVAARQSESSRFQISDPAQLRPASQAPAALDLSECAVAVAVPLSACGIASAAAVPLAARPACLTSPEPSLAAPVRAAPRRLQLVAAGPIQRLLARPKVYSPRTPRLVAFPRIPGPLPTVVGLAASGGVETILSRSIGQCQMSETALPHPASFLRAVPAAAPAQVLAPFPQKARVAGIRRSSLELQPAGFRASQMLPVPVAAVAAKDTPSLREAAAVDRLAIFRPRLRLAIIAARDGSSPFSALSQLSGGKFILSWAGLRRRWGSSGCCGSSRGRAGPSISSSRAFFRRLPDSKPI